MHPVKIFVIARNRPIYLWACLDAIYRHTKHSHSVTLIDAASDDPAVGAVTRGFIRRGLLTEHVLLPDNDPRLIINAIRERLTEDLPYFVYMEADAIVADHHPCWLSRMTAIMNEHVELAMLGAAIDQRDFVDAEAVAHLRGEETDQEWSTLLKLASPERNQRPEEATGNFFSPHTPAGRLLLLRTAAAYEVPISRDSEFARALQSAGWETGIAVNVFHRHLSLLHVFDLPHYDVRSRDAFMGSFREY